MSKHCWRLLAAFLMTFLWLGWTNGALHAAGVVGNGTPSSCTDAAYATAMNGGGLVAFDCGPNPITISVTTKVIGNGNSTTLDGGGLVTLDGNSSLQLFLVLTGGKLSLQNITLANGNFSNGGAVFVAANSSLQMNNVTVRDCEADGGGNDGGAIQNSGALVITGSRFVRNHADDGGGAIYHKAGSAEIHNTLFVSNTAISGGALYQAGGVMTVTTSLLEGNIATQQGGGLYANNGTLNAGNVTITRNQANRGGGVYGRATGAITLLNTTLYSNTALSGGGIWNDSGLPNVSLKNTIVALNYAVDSGGNPLGLNCDGPAMGTLGHNLISDMTCITPLASDQQNTNPKLGSLALNGGIVRSYEPQPGSPAIDAGSNNGCPTFDQRGYPRPIGLACDVGAVEVGRLLWLALLSKN